jgi:hypothetical protein
MANRYYVGGSGSQWDLTSSWSASSGGASGASVPTSSDNVFFDVNSGLQSASTIGYSSASSLPCSNATFSQGGIITFSGSMTLEVYGNAVLLNISSSPSLQVSFYGSGTQTLQSNGTVGIYNSYAAGTVTLLDTLNADAIEIYSGTFDLNGQNVNTEAFVVISGTSTIYLRTGTVTCSSAFIINSSGITLVPGTATVKIVGSFGLNGQTVTNLVTTGSVIFPTAGTITNLSLARGFTYQFVSSASNLTITNPIVQTGTGVTTLSLQGGSSNYTITSPVQQYLSDISIGNCTAAGTGVPFRAIGSSSVSPSCVNWIKPYAIVFAGD